MQGTDSLDPVSTEAVEQERCLHAGVVPKIYRDIIRDMTVRRKIKDETVGKAESPYSTKEEMRACAGEGHIEDKSKVMGQGWR